MRHTILPVLLLATLLLGPVLLVEGQGRTYEPTWESLRARPYPQWFKDAKLGIFIHWGVSSVPAYGGRQSYAEWYLRGLQMNDSLRTTFMKRNYGESFTYNDFARLFKAELFQPDEWADLFRRAGARYVVMVTKHHDGYALWPSKYAPGWNSMDVGPRRDLVGDLAQAVRRAGLRMGVYYSLPEWNHPLHRWYTDPDTAIAPYVEQHMIPQFKELITTYRPDVVFTDGEWNNTAEDWHARELIAWYFNLIGDDAIVNDRWGHGANIGFLTPEYSSGISVTDRPWTEVRGLGRSFGLNRNEPLDQYMTPEELIHFFARAVANGGGIILNVGPQADGQIPLLQQERLVQLGEWLQVNGEAIYGSTPWTRTGEEREVTLSRIDPSPAFNWVRDTPGAPIKEDDFTARWEGYLRPRAAATYRFEAEADDGVRVWVGDRLVVDRWTTAAEGATGNVMEHRATGSGSGTMKLEAGRMYPIRIEYFETKQNAHLRLFWSVAGQEREVIPTSQLFTDAEGKSPGLKAEYRSMQQHLVYTVNGGHLYAITLDWPDRELVLPIERPAAGTAITLLGYEGNLPWRYADGRLHIDISGITYRQMPGEHAWTFRIKDYIKGRK